jgi:hypothetical protein
MAVNERESLREERRVGRNVGVRTFDDLNILQMKKWGTGRVGVVVSQFDSRWTKKSGTNFECPMPCGTFKIRNIQCRLLCPRLVWWNVWCAYADVLDVV